MGIFTGGLVFYLQKKYIFYIKYLANLFSMAKRDSVEINVKIPWVFPLWLDGFNFLLIGRIADYVSECAALYANNTKKKV